LGASVGPRVVTVGSWLASGEPWPACGVAETYTRAILRYLSPGDILGHHRSADSTMDTAPNTYVAFHDGRRLATGSLREIALSLALLPIEVRGAALIFDAATSEPADIDFDGTLAEIVERTERREQVALETPERRGRGRPRLGVVAREVTLLPRHWDWLAEQPGGASVALRRLVDQARRAHSDRDTIRRAQEAAYRFMAATLGNAPGFEEAIRALFAADEAGFEALTAPWPTDLRDHTRELARPAFWIAAAPATLPDATGS
jgi:uncharacterized protein